MNAWRRFLWCCTLVDVGALVFNNTVIVHVFYKASFMGLTEGYCSCYSVFCSLWVLCYFWKVHCCWCPAFGRDTGLLFTCCFLFFMDTQLDSISQPHLQLGMTIWLILPSGMWAEIVSLLNPAHKFPMCRPLLPPLSAEYWYPREPGVEDGIVSAACVPEQNYYSFCPMTIELYMSKKRKYPKCKTTKILRFVYVLHQLELP